DRLPADRTRRRSAAHLHGDGLPGDRFHRSGHPRAAVGGDRGRGGADRGRLGPGLDPRPDSRGRPRDDAPTGDRRVSAGVGPGWLVLARPAYDEPLRHVGVVIEEDENLALVAARSIYDEQSWIEMVIVPRSEIREAIRS